MHAWNFQSWKFFGGLERGEWAEGGEGGTMKYENGGCYAFGRLQSSLDCRDRVTQLPGHFLYDQGGFFKQVLFARKTNRDASH